ncbi:MAG: protein kinase domain-containing protein, partial [Ktedonobacteraceae bacterium]
STIGRSFCPQCNTALPLRATFCGSCGERVKRKKQVAVIDEQDINHRYRITTLVRRRPHIHLYFAQDTFQAPTQSRMVAIRDIEITGLTKEARTRALALAQQEYDRLRSWHIPHIMASIEMRVFQDHLFLISGMPFLPREAASNQGSSRLYTLQDFLQSGQGLPKEARALAWVRGLCQTVERLHRQQIVPGDLDPYTIVLNKNSAEAEPRLMISWIPPELLQLLGQPAESSTPQVSYFSAPEALEGRAETRSDVYSLGALLYLLLTGTPPDESTLRHRRRLRSPRELNARINAQLDECVMQALALDPAERFASASALMVALENARLHLISSKMPGPAVQPHEVNSADAETVRIIPLSQRDMARWRAAREQAAMQNTHIMPVPPVATPLPQEQGNGRGIGPLPTTPYPGSKVPAPGSQQGLSGRDTPPPAPVTPQPAWKRRLTGILPALKPEQSQAPAKQIEKGKAAKKKVKL